MPSEAEMRAHNENINNPRSRPGSVLSIPRSAYRPQVPRRPQHDLETMMSTSTNASPTLNIYATLNGDIAYEPDPRWERAFGRAGYKINVHAVPDLGEIDNERILYSQYARQPYGTLRVNGEKIPLVYTRDGPVYNAAGFEHGRIYAPLGGPPQGEIRLVQEQQQMRSEGQNNPLEGKKGIMCGLGVALCCLAACILPCVCHL